MEKRDLDLNDLYTFTKAASENLFALKMCKSLRLEEEK